MSLIEWVAMSYMLTLTIFLPFFGRLADMFGRSRLYNAGFVVFTVGSLFCGMATSAMFLIVARVIQAVGAGLLQANSVALITQAFPGTERGKAIGIQGAVQAIAMAVGPFVGGVLIATIGWRSVFYINIPIGILGTIAALYILPPNEKTTKKESIDYLGTIFFASGLAFLVLGFNEVVSLGWGSYTIIVYFIHACVLLGLFVLTELRVEHPLIDLKLFKNSHIPDRQPDRHDVVLCSIRRPVPYAVLSGKGAELQPGLDGQPPHAYPTRHGARCAVRGTYFR